MYTLLPQGSQIFSVGLIVAWPYLRRVDVELNKVVTNAWKAGGWGGDQQITLRTPYKTKALSMEAGRD